MVEIEKDDVIGIGILATVIGGFGLLFYSLGGCWGSRGITNHYSFQFKGENAYVKHDDVKWGPDKYWIELANGSKIITGTIISDDNKKIKLVGANASPTIEDVVEGK